ncbi:MAG TPA: response regulator [Stellaceae bacterium]|nr:response regulator [Stellaceae bacterium]
MARILIVEDSPTQAAKLEFILNGHGFDTETARNGAEAMGLVRARPPDVVVSDIVMPGVTGYELCRQIKAEFVEHQIPVVLVSSLNEPMDIIRGLECGADNFLTKPYEEQHLIDRITALLRNREIRSAKRLSLGVDIVFLGQRLTITSEKEQILDLLISSFEDTVRANRELQASRAELAIAHERIEDYARRLEDKVRVSEEKFALLMETAHDAIIVLDHSGVVREANLKFEELIGRPKSNILGASYAALLDADAAGEQPPSLASLLASPGTRVVDLSLRREDGSQIWVDLSASRVDLAGERLIMMIVHDVTDRKNTEAQFRQLQKMDALGRLTGGVAHDFNNLLGIIVGNADAIVEKAGEDQFMGELAQEVLSAALRGAELTKRLLAFARMQPLDPKRLDIGAVLPGVATMLRRTLGATIEVRMDAAPSLWPIKADQSQVEDALLNLSINARDAMPDGGTLLIEASNEILDEEYAAENLDVVPGAYVLLAVSDTGTGIAPEIIERILEPFFTTKPPGQGTGLGLSMVYGFVKQSGGHLKIYSEIGHGTTIKLYLPRAEGADTEALPTSATDHLQRGGGERILVVDDSAELRAVTIRMLEGLGYRTVEAVNAAAALQLLEAGERFDMLFTDIVMPGGISGEQLIDRARELQPGLPALLTSGYSEVFASGQNMAVAGVGVVRKPYRKVELAARIRDVLSRRG